MIRPALCAIVLLLAAQGHAQTAAEAARDAIALLDTSAVQLEEATSGRKQVKALTETVKGYEQGLSALRDGMRLAAAQQARLERNLLARETEIAELLALLQAVSRVPAPVGLTHPAGPAGTARAGMLLADVTPSLQAQVETLRAQVQEIEDLQVLQQHAAETLEKGLTGAQDARTALSQAVADRTDLPRRFDDDPIQTAVMVAASETLESFASALATITDDPTIPQPQPIGTLRGELPLPVTGTLLRRAGEADAAGVVRPGILVATGQSALVTSPVPVTIRYAGPLLNYGLVSILEPQKGTLFIFAGLAQTFGEAGQVLPTGDPVGLMGARSQSGERAGNTRTETLYIEVRENGQPIDPEVWFRATRE